MAAEGSSVPRRSDLNEPAFIAHLPRELSFFINDPEDAKNAIQSDYDYYRRSCARWMALFSAGAFRIAPSDCLFELNPMLGEKNLLGQTDAPVVANAHAISDAFLKLHADLSAKLKKQLGGSSFVPTVERLLEKMLAQHGATAQQCDIFSFLAMYQVAPFDQLPNADKLINADGYGRSGARFQPVRTQDRYRDPPAALFASPSLLNYLFTLKPSREPVKDESASPFSLPAVLGMFNKSSPWVKCRLAPAIQHPDENVNSQSTEGNRLVFMGMQITPTYLHAMESQVLQDALAKSPAFLASEAGKAHLAAAAARAKEKAVEEAGASAQTVSSNPICAALRNRDKKQKDSVYTVMSAIAGGGGGGGGGGAEGGEDGSDGMMGTRTESLVGLDRQDSAAAAASSSGGMGVRKSTSMMNVEAGAVDLQLSGEEEHVDPASAAAAKSKDNDASAADGDEDDGEEEENINKPFESDLDYLQEQFRVLVLTKNVVTLEVKLEASKDVGSGVVQVEDEDDVPSWRRRGPSTGNESVKLEADVRKARSRLALRTEVVRARLRVTAQSGTWYPRLEILADALKLSKFERCVLLQLVKNIISPDRGDRYGGGRSELKTIGALQEAFCSTLKERMATRECFYKTGSLIESGLIFLSEFESEFLSDLSEAGLVIDKRMVDLLCGLESEFSNLLSAGHLYQPNTSVDDVVIPADAKKKIMDIVLAFEKTQRLTDRAYEDPVHGGSSGKMKGSATLLFHGSPGTGKTMMANAIATTLKRKILLVNFPNLGSNSAGTIIRFLFREAKISKAVIFFDECESLFMDREKSGSFHVNTVLTEMERFQGLCVMATNMATMIDSAMRRRISLAVHFARPDHVLRETVWKTLQPRADVVPLDETVDFTELALRFELSGGLISNAWRGAINSMVVRKANKISQEDLKRACGDQLRGNLSASEMDQNIVPHAGLDVLVVDEKIREGLEQIISYSKAQSVLVSQWGFKDRFSISKGIAVMLCGAPGTGKTQCASCLAYELGKPLKIVNVAQILSKWVGESEKNLVNIFAEARGEDALLVLDEAESLFGARKADSARWETSQTGVLLQLVENFQGTVLVITNMKELIDPAFCRRFRFILEFKHPTPPLRKKIWQMAVPPECPVADDVDFGRLASAYDLTGAEIKQTLLRAATKCALRPEAKRKIFMADLEASAKLEMEKKNSVSDAVQNMFL